MVSLGLLVILTLPDAYLAQGLCDSARYMATRNGGMCSWMLLNLHMAHIALVLCLMVLGNSTCAGAPVLFAIRSLSGPILLVLLSVSVPLPVMVLQRRAKRIGRTEPFDRL